jgi:DNA-binding transcriptional MerR regulator
MAKARETFSAGEASRITGVPYRTLDHWATTKFIAPSIATADGTGSERKYNFSDLVSLRVARELREGGVSTQALRKVVTRLRAFTKSRNPLADSHLVVVGSDVQLVENCHQIVSLLKKPGQGVFAFMVNFGRVVNEVKQEVKALRAA